jgi:hypothetical protein
MIGSMIWRGQATDSGTASRHRANVTTQAAGGAHRERTSRHHHDTAPANFGVMHNRRRPRMSNKILPPR